MSFLIALLIVSLSILIHEAGHFVAARACGLPVKIVSVGFGPRLLGVTIAQTDYRLSLLPIGGYVLFGSYKPHTSADTATPADLRTRLMRALVPSPGTISLASRPFRDRVIVAFAGPLVNLAAMVLLLAVYNTVTAGLAADHVFVRPFVQSKILVGSYVESISSGIALSDLAGLIGILKVGTVWATSLHQALQFAIILNLGLAITNLLPIPPLDGGHIMLAITGRLFPSVERRIVQPVQLLGTAFVLVLFVLTTWQDLLR